MLGRKNSQPQVWVRFERKMEDGKIMKFKVQDIEEEMFDDIVQFMDEHFVPDEAFCNSSDLMSNKSRLDQLNKYWRFYLLPQNMSLVCLEDIEEEDWSPRIFGVNCLLHVVKGNHEIPDGYELPPVFGDIINFMEAKIDIFSKYNVDEYMGDLGLCVDKSCRGMKIGLEILKARIPLCQAMGIHVIETIFTAHSSQNLAARAGYETVLEVEYEELSSKLNVQIPEGSPKVIKTMTKIVK